MAKFIPGLKLAEGYYREVVAPILADAHPDLPYAAALIGRGSEVLGYDTEMSMDHDWGPRCQIFLPESFDTSFRNSLSETLALRLPKEYRGLPTNFVAPDKNEPANKRMTVMGSGPVNHLVEITTLKEFSEAQLGLDATNPLSEEQWLALPQRDLLSMTSGRVFRDDIGLEELRTRLAWYPRDVWLYVLGCIWWRFRRDEKIVGRVGIVSDEVGASVVTGRIARDLMRLALCMERTYAPYAKWLGTAFSALEVASQLGPQLTLAMQATNWLDRDQALAPAYEMVAEMHNKLGLTKPFPAKCQQFRNRPFHIIEGGMIARALFAEVQSPLLSKLFKQGVLGNIDLITDSDDVCLSTKKQGRILRMFEVD